MQRFKEFSSSDLFLIYSAPHLDKISLNKDGPCTYPYVTRTRNNNGIDGYTGFIDDEHLNPEKTFSLGLMQMNVNYQNDSWYSGQFIKVIQPKFELDEKVGLYLLPWLQRLALKFDPQAIRNVDGIFYSAKFTLPVKDNETLDLEYMRNYVSEVEKRYWNKMKLGFDLK
ncbi:restriction endonuclease subunit S [Lactobacillus gasseri]|jgi:hypothetical protein|uniref:Type I restriction modification DNA specificity domain-containing protein n=3 Tax=Lactobacillus gasseri TaxID=1596 RepID=A0ABY3BEI8_LACGS|nr:restriction endonuclease subunit S [Lactobacillus gasseri]EFB62543.1 hypothetical protein HMPREF9209_0104 [Lactobacillus gasseri 224-1]KFL96342.1 putative type II restriction enzyme [Lactobacillus gasseri SV-16A-US]MCZ3760949.1 restriction endonuclease subunit S [Lactobacillus gasseri]MCZ3762732.1 restriction endonuclease subunit S [Lactobacillus gasseri]MCZ3766255.1 restriction endonuclease subunit S [Lactobacillus gasseri]